MVAPRFQIPRFSHFLEGNPRAAFSIRTISATSIAAVIKTGRLRHALRAQNYLRHDADLKLPPVN
jgi:hypothetical protein